LFLLDHVIEYEGELLVGLVEELRTVDDLAADGHDRDEVVRVLRLVDRAEHKRRQAAPGPKVSRRAFGRDRRVPITSGFDAAPEATPRTGPGATAGPTEELDS
jgi:hypothetical protein